MAFRGRFRGRGFGPGPGMGPMGPMGPRGPMRLDGPMGPQGGYGPGPIRRGRNKDMSVMGELKQSKIIVMVFLQTMLLSAKGERLLSLSYYTCDDES